MENLNQIDLIEVAQMNSCYATDKDGISIEIAQVEMGIASYLETGEIGGIS